MSGLLQRLFSGWIEVSIRGHQAERLITELTLQGFRMWRIHRYGDELRGVVTKEGLHALKGLAERKGFRLVTGRQGGLPFQWRRMKSRPFLLVGLVTAWIMVMYATSHIWAIQVNVPNLGQKTQQMLIRTAEASGLRLGSRRQNLNIQNIRRHMLMMLPQYSWIGLHIQGMVAVIDGIKLINRPPLHLPPRLIATASGKVTAVEVYMGSGEVLPGDEVHRGQTLISGVVTGSLPGQSNGAAKPIEESVLTPAEGEVMADVRYTVKVYQSFQHRVAVETGRTFTEQFLEFDHSEIVAIPHLGSLSYAHYTVKKKHQTISWAGVKLPVQLIQIVYNERVLHVVEFNAKEAIHVAKAQALRDEARIVPKGGIRMRQTFKVKPGKRGVWVTLTWIVNRNIAGRPETANNR